MLYFSKNYILRLKEKIFINNMMFELVFLQLGSEGDWYNIFIDIGKWINNLTGGLFFGDMEF